MESDDTKDDGNGNVPHAEPVRAPAELLPRRTRRPTGSRTMARDLVRDTFVMSHGERERVRDPRPRLDLALHDPAIRRLGRRYPEYGTPDRGSMRSATPRGVPFRRKTIGRPRTMPETLEPHERELLHLKLEERPGQHGIGRRTGSSADRASDRPHRILVFPARRVENQQESG